MNRRPPRYRVSREDKHQRSPVVWAWFEGQRAYALCTRSGTQAGGHAFEAEVAIGLPRNWDQTSENVLRHALTQAVRGGLAIAGVSDEKMAEDAVNAAFTRIFQGPGAVFDVSGVQGE